MTLRSIWTYLFLSALIVALGTGYALWGEASAPATDGQQGSPVLLFLFAFACAGLIFSLLGLRDDLRVDRIGKAIARFAGGDGSARVARGGSDAIARLGGLFNDMADRLGNERINLAESEERLKFALHGSDAGIWDWRIDSGHTYYSPRWKELLGYAENELQAHSEEC